MKIVPLGPGFAAELRGVTLAEITTDDAAYAAARAAFEEHSVLVFRGQEVTDETQLAFSRRFGPPEVTKIGLRGTGTHFVILSMIGEDGKVVPADHQLALGNKANQLWHTDSSFKKTPALASVLSSRTLPKIGGETEFVSMRLAWERLPPQRQAQLSDLIVRHSYAASRDQIDPELMTPAERDELPPVRWRMTWRNPANNRRALYLASHAYAVEGMGDHEGRALIAELVAAATRPEATYRHAWRTGDVLMWDNRATMHRGRPWPAGEARVMVRTTVQAIEADGLSELRPTA